MVHEEHTILLLSDLHLEFAPFEPVPLKSAADVVVLAGDIHLGDRGISWARKAFPENEIVYVPGNHEYYGGRLDTVDAQMYQAGRRLGVHVLQNAEVTLRGIRYLGTTLWTDFAIWGEAEAHRGMRAAEQEMADFERIGRPPQVGNQRLVRTLFAWPKAQRLRARDTLMLHHSSRVWLDQALDRGIDEGLDLTRTVVVTHHFSTLRSCAIRYCDDPLTAAFGSNLESMMGRCGLWLHGHTHDSFHSTVREARPIATQVICNPRGYPRQDGSPENQDFRGDFCLQLKAGAWEAV